MKHHKLSHSQCREPGYTAPAAPKSTAGGGYPHKQPAPKHEKSGGKKGKWK